MKHSAADLTRIHSRAGGAAARAHREFEDVMRRLNNAAHEEAAPVLDKDEEGRVVGRRVEILANMIITAEDFKPSGEGKVEGLKPGKMPTMFVHYVRERDTHFEIRLLPSGDNIKGNYRVSVSFPLPLQVPVARPSEENGSPSTLHPGVTNNSGAPIPHPHASSRGLGGHLFY